MPDHGRIPRRFRSYLARGTLRARLNSPLRKKEKERENAMATAQRLSTLINGVNVDELFATVAAVRNTPTLARFKFSIENRWEVGAHNLTTVDAFCGAGEERSHPHPFDLRSDEPAVLL